MRKSVKAYRMASNHRCRHFGLCAGLALLFGAPQAYLGYELLRAWSFGGISRFDAAFLLLWLAAAIFRFGFIVRAVRSLCERLAEGPVNAEVAR